MGKDGAWVVDWKAFLAFVDVVDVNPSVVDLLLSALQRDPEIEVDVASIEVAF